MATESVATPEVLWAQRSSSTDPSKNFIYLTISVPDVPSGSAKLDLKPTGLTFEGRSDTLKRNYHLDLEFFDEIIPEQSKTNHTGKNFELKLQKNNIKDKFWPRLLKNSQKVHFVKTNFDKWVDEDEQNEAPEDDFSQFGGMGGMPGMGGGEDFGGLDFSKLSGDAGAMDEDDDDDEMPPLEGEDEETEKKAEDITEDAKTDKIVEVVEDDKKEGTEA